LPLYIDRAVKEIEGGEGSNYYYVSLYCLTNLYKDLKDSPEVSSNSIYDDFVESPVLLLNRIEAGVYCDSDGYEEGIDVIDKYDFDSDESRLIYLVSMDKKQLLKAANLIVNVKFASAMESKFSEIKESAETLSDSKDDYKETNDWVNITKTVFGGVMNTLNFISGIYLERLSADKVFVTPNPVEEDFLNSLGIERYSDVSLEKMYKKVKNKTYSIATKNEIRDGYGPWGNIIGSAELKIQTKNILDNLTNKKETRAEIAEKLSKDGLNENIVNTLADELKKIDDEITKLKEELMDIS
jgi:hypothetical protein